MPDDITSLAGPVELYRGELALRIPLSEGGDKFISCTRGIAEVDGEYLTIIIKPWLAEKLGLVHGSWVSIDNENGKFNMSPTNAEGADLA